MMRWKTWLFRSLAVVLGAATLGGAGAYAQYRQTEQPAYQTLVSEKRFELRQYDPMIVAEVTHSGDRRRASSASFRRLAAYIFGQDRPAGGEPIAMTSPVIQDRVDQDQPIAMTSPVLQDAVGEGEWRMRFVMPSRFTMETLPQPPADITLSEVPERRMAAVRFNGYASNSDLTIMQAMLTDWVEQQGLTMIGDFEFAFYDDPSVPGPRRRNEVLVEVRAD